MATKQTQTNRVDLAGRLKRWRTWRGKQLGRKMTQEEAAGELGLTVGAYINYEHDHRYPRQQMLVDMLVRLTTIPRNGNNGKAKTSAPTAKAR